MIILFDRILVDPIKPEEKTAKGIYLPPSNEKSQIGTVILTGGEVTQSIEENSKILYEKGTGIEVKIEEKDYIILNQKNVLAILDLD